MSIKISERTNSSVPAGTRIYAVGDIHGRVDLLDRLLERIEADRKRREEAETVFVFLGDYVDRGENSMGVAGRLISGLPDDVTAVFLKGNHEDLLLSFLDRPGFGLNWLFNGGDVALLSYGVEADVIRNAYYSGPAGLAKAASIFRDLLPEDHLQFYRALQLSYRAGGYYFVHAGVRPGVALDSQNERDLIWIRDEFLNHPHDFGAVVVHGHTPVGSPEDLHNRIGIDTLAFRTGRLTAVGLEGSRRWFLST
ncbi:MAG: metallophosphoesterase [Rhodomicrobium sp.]